MPTESHSLAGRVRHHLILMVKSWLWGMHRTESPLVLTVPKDMSQHYTTPKVLNRPGLEWNNNSLEGEKSNQIENMTHKIIFHKII